MSSVDTFPLDTPALLAFCERQQSPDKHNDETGQIALHHRILDSDSPIDIIPYLSRRMVSLILALPFRVPPARLPFLGEATTRLNSASYMGTWVMNVETGEIYFRVTLPSIGAAYGDEALLFVARLVASTVENAARGLQRVAFEDKSFQEVFGPAG